MMDLQQEAHCAKLATWQPKNTSKSTTVEIGTSGLLSRKRIRKSMLKNGRNICANTEIKIRKGGHSQTKIENGRINEGEKDMPLIQNTARKCELMPRSGKQAIRRNALHKDSRCTV